MKKIRQVLRSDDSGHEYCIPLSVSDEFDSMMEQMEEGDYEDLELVDKFCRKFDQYRLNMHIHNYSFVDLQEIDK